jgi:hypothetical protein
MQVSSLGTVGRERTGRLSDTANLNDFGFDVLKSVTDDLPALQPDVLEDISFHLQGLSLPVPTAEGCRT